MLRLFYEQTVKLLLTLFVLATLVFIIMRILPGDPAVRLAGIDADVDSIVRIQEKLGTDRSIVIQYLDWIQGIIQFDFGRSYVHAVPVVQLIRTAFPYSVLLALASFLLSVLFALILVFLSCYSRFVLYLVRVIEVFFISIPLFWLSLLLVLIFSVYFELLPSFGYMRAEHYILPIISLSLANCPLLIRHLRISLQGEMDKPYVLFARAQGFSPLYLLIRVAGPNACLAFIHISAIQLGYLLGGSVIIESIFVLPGMGRLTLHAILNRDYPLVQATVFLFASIFIVCMNIADLLLQFINPRLRRKF